MSKKSKKCPITIEMAAIHFLFKTNFTILYRWQPAQHSANCSLHTTVWCSNFNILKEYLMRYDRLLKNISGILPEDLAIENYECIFENC